MRWRDVVIGEELDPSSALKTLQVDD